MYTNIFPGFSSSVIFFHLHILQFREKGNIKFRTVLLPILNMVTATIIKETAHTETGLVVLAVYGSIIITGISNESPFARTGLKVGQKIVFLNDIPFSGLSTEMADDILRQAVGCLTVVADDMNNDVSNGIPFTNHPPADATQAYPVFENPAPVAPPVNTATTSESQQATHQAPPQVETALFPPGHAPPTNTASVHHPPGTAPDGIW